MLPARAEELKKSAARTGALTALIQAKAWVPEFDLVEAAQGYPSLKEDATEFDEEDLRLVEEAHLSHYQANYDDKNKRVAAPIPEAKNLIPPIRKHTYAPDIEPSLLISDEAVFKASTGIKGQLLISSHWVGRKKLNWREMIGNRQVKPVTKREPEAGLEYYML